MKDCPNDWEDGCDCPRCRLFAEEDASAKDCTREAAYQAELPSPALTTRAKRDGHELELDFACYA